ncbi:hypothetical protein ACWEK5_41620 [Rhodococcus koreensis]
MPLFKAVNGGMHPENNDVHFLASGDERQALPERSIQSLIRQDERMNPAEDAIRLIRCASEGDLNLQGKIVNMYTQGDSRLIRSRQLVTLQAYLISELAFQKAHGDAMPWFDRGHINAIAGVHEDAYFFTKLGFEGDWDGWWEFIGSCAPHAAPIEGIVLPTPIQELLLELAQVGGRLWGTEPGAYKNWPEDWLDAEQSRAVASRD